MGVRARLLPQCRPGRGLSALGGWLIRISTPLSGLSLSQTKAGPGVGTDATGGGGAVVERCFEPVAVRPQEDATGGKVGRAVAACARR